MVIGFVRQIFKAGHNRIARIASTAQKLLYSSNKSLIGRCGSAGYDSRKIVSSLIIERLEFTT